MVQEKTKKTQKLKNEKGETDTLDVVVESEEAKKEKIENGEEDRVEEKSDDEDSQDSAGDTLTSKNVEEDLVEENISEEIEGVEELDKDITTEEKIPDFKVGDTIRVSYKIIEGEKVRTQPYQGIVIAKKGSGMSKTFTVRKIGADSIGVERIFPLFSPNIEKVNIMKRGKVRRAKLYYLRDRIGRKATRIKEKVSVKE